MIAILITILLFLTIFGTLSLALLTIMIINIVGFSILAIFERKNHLLVSKCILLIGIISIILITSIILTMPEQFQQISALYILFVSLITFALKIYFEEVKKKNRNQKLKKTLIKILKNVKLKSSEYLVRLDEEMQCLSNYYKTFEIIDFNFPKIEDIILEIDIEFDENTVEYFENINSYIHSINDKIPELRKLLKEKERITSLENTEEFMRLTTEKKLPGTIPHPSNNKLVEGLEDLEKLLYWYCGCLALYSDMLILNDFKENENDERYILFKNIIESNTFEEKINFIRNSQIFKEYEDYFCNFRGHDGKTLADKYIKRI